MATVTRTSIRPVLTGCFVSDGAALRELLKELSVDAPAVVADLSLGSWRGRAVAHEWGDQLGLSVALSVPSRPRSRLPGSTPMTYADQIASGIDYETRGDGVALSALELANRLVTHLGTAGPRTLVVIAPRWGRWWGRDNTLLIRCVAEGLEERGRMVVVSAGDHTPAPSEWEVDWPGTGVDVARGGAGDSVGLVPGVLQPALVHRLVLAGLAGAQAVRLSDSTFVLAPDARVDPRTVPATAFDLVAAAVEDDSWVHAYANCSGSDELVRPDVLWRHAFRCLEEDGHEAALALIDRVMESARSPEANALAAVGAQGVRLRMRRYADAARLVPPSDDVPSDLRAFLLESKGWGLTMTGRVEEAEPCLETARSLTTGDTSLERSYLLNISALNRLKLGDAVGAMDMEREIERSLSAEPEPDPHLTYINALNIARLLRRLGDPDGAIVQYRRAFRTTAGTTSESDAVYQHFCLARALGEAGRKDESFLEWLVASLRWVAADAPEALTPRAVLGIVQARPAHHETVDRVSLALRDALNRAAHDAGIDSMPLPGPLLPEFVCTETSRSAEVTPSSLCGVGSPGRPGVLLSTGQCAPAYRSAEFDRLRGMVWAHLAPMVWAHLAPGSPHPATVLVDDRFGIGVPLTCAGLLEVCIRVGADAATHGGLRHDLDCQRRAELTALLHGELGPAVSAVKDQHALFRRCRPPRPLTEEELQVLVALGNGNRVGTLGHGIETVRAMERARVVRLRLSDDDI